MKFRMLGCVVLVWNLVAEARLVSIVDELMPVPVSVECGERSVPVGRLKNVTVTHSAVSGAPSAIADEAYILEIGEEGVKITASGEFGERWARVTLDQLVRLADGGDVPCCRIVDWPSLKWRGFMLDSSRNYLPPQGIKDIIDMMSRYKLNLFHWHLTENYAWRLESKRHPELQSERAFLHRHKGMFYTQNEFREIADYAYARGVRLMPELDFPGHALAFRRAFGFKTMSDPGVVEKLESLFDELCTLAPKEKMPFIHIGTDEVWKRELEGAPRETLERVAKVVARNGRTVVSWVEGESYDCPGPRINMLWTTTPDKHPGAYFDAAGMYIENMDPLEMVSIAVYHKAARWHDAGELNQGAIFCAWHDGFAGLPYENLLRNQPIFPACVLFGNSFWRSRERDLMPQYRRCMPQVGDPLLMDAMDAERRTVAQRDRALRDLRHPFHFLRQTDMRWRMSAPDGTILATDIAQASISPERIFIGRGMESAVTNASVTLDTWIKSSKDQIVGAWIGFTNISRDHGLLHSAPLPDVGEWNRFGAAIEINGEKIAPPKWKRPGLKKGNAIQDWTPAWTLYEIDEEPFTDQEYYMREPTSIHLRKGWNHVKLTLPNPYPGKLKRNWYEHNWTATFIPVSGETDHPCEVEGLEYSSIPPTNANGAFASPVERSFRASCDGSEQKYIVIEPETQKPFVGVLVALHGHGADRRQFAEDGRGECKAAREAAADHGLLFVSPDYRAQCSWMGPKAEADMLDLMKVLSSEYGVSTFYFCGASMGGTSALTFAVRHPSLVAGVVALNPLADHLPYDKFQNAISASFGGDKKSAYDEYYRRSAVNYPERFTMPVSITVGGADKTVPPDSARLLAQKIAFRRPDLIYFDEVADRGHKTDYEASKKAFDEMFRRAEAAVPRYRDNTIRLAAVNSSAPDISAADFVCSGENDEVIFNNAASLLPLGGRIVLADGDYYFDACTNEGGSAVFLGYNQGRARVITFAGVTDSKAYNTRYGAGIHVTEKAMRAMATNGVYRVFFGSSRHPPRGDFGPYPGDFYTYTYVNNLRLENMQILFHDASKPLRGVDASNFGSIYMRKVYIYTENYFRDRFMHIGRPDIPISGTVGVWSTWGSNDEAAETRYDHVQVGGLHTGFVFNGIDHLIMEVCAACRCVQGYDFRRGAKTLTVINCADEGNTYLPIFRGKGGHITMIDFNIERFNEKFIPVDPIPDKTEHRAIEEFPGSWHGEITYTLQGGCFGFTRGTNQFWASGCGANVRTVDQNASKSTPCIHEAGR